VRDTRGDCLTVTFRSEGSWSQGLTVGGAGKTSEDEVLLSERTTEPFPGLSNRGSSLGWVLEHSSETSLPSSPSNEP
jgi:hypothetical protein